ncbi:MAG: hypothetical protein GC164_02060 [Phycisphaera sp.]|nr:hypothetical protein [Phycisphaera sp.]
MKYMVTTVIVAAITGITGITGNAIAQSFYNDEPPLFSMRPDPEKSLYNLTEFGPVGMSIDLIQPAFTMKIKSIDPGSPAEKAGLKPGLIIHTINGQKLADIDPRIQLGNLITKTEAGDGKMKMVVSDTPDGETRQVVVQLQVLGAYSDTWPLNCPKSDKIVRNFAQYIKAGGDQGFGSLGMLFLLSTGDESDLEHVRRWARSRPTHIEGFHTWNAGLGNLAMCEYYLRTGDEQVLPAIQAVADNIVQAENHGGWGNRAPIAHLDYGGGGGHLNAGGVHAATMLILAKLCGAKIPDESLNRVVQHFYRWAGRGNISYGNNKPEGSYTDNGKNGGFAYMMAAAAALTPEGEESIYARARDVSALFSFTSTSFLLHGHTGGGIGEVWRSAAMGLLHDKQPVLYHNFMDARRWHYEMSRRFDGSFAILGGDRYDNTSWGAGYAWSYTVPRKTLVLTGAKSKYAKPFKLPDRPWGTAEDDDFVTTQPIAYHDGTRPDFSHETQATGGGMALLDVRKEDLTDEQLNRYIRHPTIITRTYFAEQIAAKGPGFVLGLLNDKDARLRRLALDTCVTSRGEVKMIDDAIIDRVLKMIADPEESLFVKEAALRLMAHAPTDTLVKNIDLLVPYLNDDEWWLQVSAMEALGPVAADGRVYKKVLPALGQALRNNHLQALCGPLYWGAMGKSLSGASPEVAALALSTLKDSYVNYAEYEHPMKEVANRINPGMREMIARTITEVPGGYDALYEVAGNQGSGRALPYEDFYLNADTSKFSPELHEAVNEIIKTRLIPRYIAENREYLLKEKASEAIPWSAYYGDDGHARMIGLVDLYNKIGVHDYDYHDFGPDPLTMSWYYYTFDPSDLLPWDRPVNRYRPVELPAGMENWHDLNFDPKAAGWKIGLQPFGAVNGEKQIVAMSGSYVRIGPDKCPLNFCRHGEEIKTLWDKEVLLLRGKFKFPEFKEGYRYRLVYGGMSHMGRGEGYKLYINGNEFQERDQGMPKRAGGTPVGKLIDKSMWPTFSGKEVDIGQISFMNIHNGVKERHLMIWLQEMKLPPLGDEQIIGSATVARMTSSQWQALQDPDNNDLDPNEGKFLWDGKFVANPTIVGQWKAVGYVNNREEFDPAKTNVPNHARIKAITVKPDGKTDNPLLAWTGDILMDLERNEALKIVSQQIEGKAFMFIEQGGFQTRYGPDWKSPWIVLTHSE